MTSTQRIGEAELTRTVSAEPLPLILSAVNLRFNKNSSMLCRWMTWVFFVLTKKIEKQNRLATMMPIGMRLLTKNYLVGRKLILNEIFNAIDHLYLCACFHAATIFLAVIRRVVGERRTADAFYFSFIGFVIC